MSTGISRRRIMVTFVATLVISSPATYASAQGRCSKASLLGSYPGKAVSRYDLMEAVWGYRNETASNVVDVVVRSLRRKLGAESFVVETVRGTGYRYRVPASAS